MEPLYFRIRALKERADSKATKLKESKKVTLDAVHAAGESWGAAQSLAELQMTVAELEKIIGQSEAGMGAMKREVGLSTGKKEVLKSAIREGHIEIEAYQRALALLKDTVDVDFEPPRLRTPEEIK